MCRNVPAILGRGYRAYFRYIYTSALRRKELLNQFWAKSSRPKSERESLTTRANLYAQLAICLAVRSIGPSINETCTNRPYWDANFEN